MLLLEIKRYLIAIDLLPIIAISHFMKVVLVQLTHKTCKITMLKMLGEDRSGKLVGIFDYERCAFVVPAKCVFKCLVFQHSEATVSYHHSMNCDSMPYLNSFWINSGTEPELSLIFEVVFVCFIMALLFDMTKNHVLENFEEEREKEEREKQTDV